MSQKRLLDVLERIDTALDRRVLPMVIFDLDSTLFSTAPRNWKILQEFAAVNSQHAGLQAALRQMSPECMGWNVHEDLRRFGLADENLLQELKKFWFSRFFTDEYVLIDSPLPGAVEFAEACHERGAMLYYLTGRHVGGMEQGTARALVEKGFPFWRGRCVLHLKPSFEMNDRAFKDDALADIRSYYGEVVASFENDPSNANMFLKAFPAALHYLLLTVHPPESENPSNELIRLRDFRMD